MSDYVTAYPIRWPVNPFRLIRRRPLYWCDGETTTKNVRTGIWRLLPDYEFGNATGY